MIVAWEKEFSATSPKRQRVEYDTLAREGWSHAERPDRVVVSGVVVHRGWVSDHEGFALYEQYAEHGYTTPEE